MQPRDLAEHKYTHPKKKRGLLKTPPPLLDTADWVGSRNHDRDPPGCVSDEAWVSVAVLGTTYD